MAAMVGHPFVVLTRWPLAGVASMLLLLTALPALAGQTANAVDGASAAPENATAATRSDVEALRDEIAELRAALAELRRDLSASRPAQLPPPVVDAQPSAVPLEMLQSQVEQLAQEKVSSGSRFPVTLSGTILSNTVYNSGDANWLEGPNLVGRTSTGSLTSTMRQSRLGLDVGVIPVGGWNARGTLILDFFGGTPGFVTGTVMGLPRLLYAFGRLERSGTAIQVGQDQVLLAPRDPTSLAAFAFPQFFRSGNLYLRAPQVRLEQKLGPVTAKAGIVAPVVGDAGPEYVFAPPAGAGERSERPAVEGHLGFDRGDDVRAAELHVGVSGHYGWSKFGATQVGSSAGAVDFLARAGRVGVAGELYTAEDMDAYGAGVAQRGRSEGGWVEGRLRASSRISFAGGAGLDRRPDGLGQAGRLRNTSYFGNTVVRLTPEVAVSLEYKWLQTRYGPVPVNRENHHLNAVFAVTF
jgi:hypothetical protein